MGLVGGKSYGLALGTVGIDMLVCRLGIRAGPCYAVGTGVGVD